MGEIIIGDKQKSWKRHDPIHNGQDYGMFHLYILVVNPLGFYVFSPTGIQCGDDYSPTQTYT